MYSNTNHQIILGHILVICTGRSRKEYRYLQHAEKYIYLQFYWIITVMVNILSHAIFEIDKLKGNVFMGCLLLSCASFLVYPSHSTQNIQTHQFIKLHLNNKVLVQISSFIIKYHHSEYSYMYLFLL